MAEPRHRMSPPTAAVLLLTALLGAGTAASAQQPLSLAELLDRGARVVSGEALRSMMVGKAVLIEELATGERFEAIFFPSGERILRPVTRAGAGRALRERGLNSVARYTIDDDRLRFTAGDQRYEFQVFILGDSTFGYRLRDGEEEAGWRLAARDMDRPDQLTTADLAERGIEPIDGPALRRLIAGRTLTMLQRSTGDIYEVEFGVDGHSTVRDRTGTALADRSYTVFQNQLVMEIEGRAAYVTVYPTPEGYLAARSIDHGLVDFELLRRERTPELPDAERHRSAEAPRQ